MYALMTEMVMPRLSSRRGMTSFFYCMLRFKAWKMTWVTSAGRLLPSLFIRALIDLTLQNKRSATLGT